MNGTILVGTAGQGILRSVDDGATWHRLATALPGIHCVDFAA